MRFGSWIVRVLVVVVAASVPVASISREQRELTIEFDMPPSPPPGVAGAISIDQAIYRVNPALSSASTLVVGEWEFDLGPNCISEGWVYADRTAQLGDFFHVDDFMPLGGGDFGRLVPLSGFQSLWCGARPSATLPLCSYASLPGYGNHWDQFFITDGALSVVGDVTVSYLASWDTEGSPYDYVAVEFDNYDDNWIEVQRHGGIGSGSFAVVIPGAEHTGNVRVRFHFVSDALGSDEDGLWNTDGAVIIDDLSVSDAGGPVLPLEDFESYVVGERVTLHWYSTATSPFGDFSALYPGLWELQEDPCYWDLTCLWGFYNGSTVNYACGGHPAQQAVPMVNERNQYIANEVWSPLIDWIGVGSSAYLEFDVYRDLPFESLVAYVWHVRSWVMGCPSVWKDRGTAYFGAHRVGDLSDSHWLHVSESIGDLIDPLAEQIQVALGCIDMCEYWCGRYGFSGCHTHAPLFDRVRVSHIDSYGPQWSVQSAHLFQDNFAGDGTTTGAVGADMAADISPYSSTTVVPGDSVVVTVADPLVGLATDPHTGFGPAVYAYVRVTPTGQPGKSGAGLTDDAFRWPVVDSLVTPWHGTWYCVRMDTVFQGPGRVEPIPNQFCVDLHDSLFTPPDTVHFFFMAQSYLGAPTIYWSEFTGPSEDQTLMLDNAMEFTCLPANGLQPGNRVFYVDDCDGSGAQPHFDTAFEQLGLTVDRYDVRGSRALCSSGPGSRVVDTFSQVIPWYKVLIWNSGDLSMGTIADDNKWEKASDFRVLFEFVDQRVGDAGIYISGNQVAEDWERKFSSSFALALLTYMDHGVANYSADQYGLNPRITSTRTGQVLHLEGDDYFALGGCPDAKEFDIIEPHGNAVLEMTYEGSSSGAVISQATQNAQGDTARAVLSAVSYHRIRTGYGREPLARVEHLRDILTWFGLVLDVGDGPCVLWEEALPLDAPDERMDHGMASHNASGHVVLFGGIHRFGGLLDVFRDDTWIWDGSNWQQVAVAGPGARGGNQMAYDAARARTVLFGGFTEPGPVIHGDTWLWDGAQWQPQLPVTSPPPRYAHGMAYDALREVVVLYGGRDNTSARNDTWVWDGTNWQDVSPVHSPPARSFSGGNGLAFDADRGVVVLFGGRGGGQLNDTWEWDGLTWTERHPEGEWPRARDGHTLAYVPGANVLMTGGDAGGYLRHDAWTWDGVSWRRLRSYPEPPKRSRHAMVYDSTRAELVLFGGENFGARLDDTWSLTVCAEGVPTDVDGSAPAVTALHPNYPNPFNPVTTIAFSLNKRSRVRLAVYDVGGRQVAVLLDEVRDPGEYTDVRWDGTNADGNVVATGVYFCQLVTRDLKATRKLVLLK